LLGAFEDDADLIQAGCDIVRSEQSRNGGLLMRVGRPSYFPAQKGHF